MKNTSTVIGIIAMVAIMGLSMTACPTDGGGTHTHQWGAWQVLVAATCMEKGVEIRSCSSDFYFEQREIAIDNNAHYWEWTYIIEPTYTDEGTGTAVCHLNSAHNRPEGPVPRKPIFNAAELTTVLSDLTVNTAATPYTLVLNVGDLGGAYNISGSVGYAVNVIPKKYINLDLSGSTFTSIGQYAFYYNQLTSITIGANVSLSNNSFDSFITAYDNGGKAAGTYTLPNTGSTWWTKQ